MGNITIIRPFLVRFQHNEMKHDHDKDGGIRDRCKNETFARKPARRFTACLGLFRAFGRFQLGQHIRHQLLAFVGHARGTKLTRAYFACIAAWWRLVARHRLGRKWLVECVHIVESPIGEDVVDLEWRIAILTRGHSHELDPAFAVALLALLAAHALHHRETCADAGNVWSTQTRLHQ